MNRIVFILTLCLLFPSVVLANYTQRDDVKHFIGEMVKKHGFDQATLTYWMKDIEQQTTALAAIARPAEATKPWKDYRPIFITSKRINQGVKFWQEHADVLARAEQHYGVPAEIIVAIIGVETFYGRRSGNYPVLDALATLGFDYPIENTTAERRDRRERFFRKELEEYLLMSREEKIDPRELKGSYAGAMGMPQFISSSFRAYAVDFDGDGKRDLWRSSADAIGSVANYFKRHGWQKQQPIISRASVKKQLDNIGNKKVEPHKSIASYKKMGVSSADSFSNDTLAALIKLDGADGHEYWLGLNNFYVITRYNHSALYAMAVYQLSQALASQHYASR
ncbi:MAG: lytic murein transglycosylase B [Gammaproteobacteria bacterium]|nr:lytic murein transglycosylase B [Gammaproteobacteria bacterium]